MSGFSDKKRFEAIQDIYKRLLGREADSSGLETYYNSDMSVERIEEIIDASDERRLLLLKEQQKFGYISMVEDWLYLGAYTKEFDKKLLLVDNGITDILDFSEKERNVFSDITGKKITKISIPTNAVMSISDTKKALSVMNEVYRSSGKESRSLLVCDSYGCTKAPAIAILWYIANGMDIEASRAFVASRVSIVSVDEMLLGPWHVSAAEQLSMED